jgi:hypothetical protein
MGSKIDNETFPDYNALFDRYRDQAVEIDCMPIEDDELQYHQRNSDFQNRRRAQMAFLQTVWPSFWKDYPQLTHKEARQLMKQGIDDVEEVLEYVAHAAEYQHRGRKVVLGKNKETGKDVVTREKLDHPVGYVIKAIRNDMKRDRATLEEFNQPQKEAPKTELVISAGTNLVKDNIPVEQSSNGHRSNEDFKF